MHNGVYAPLSTITSPNPYLKTDEREITTPSGKTLTKINPAYMTRQVYELAHEKRGVIGHITSLKPIRPENAPDRWEAMALNAFQLGREELSEIQHIGGKPYMRLMRPLIVEKSCLPCHAEQGYRTNDIRGGISVAIPMAPLWEIKHRFILELALAHSLLWIVGLAGIVFGTRRLQQQDLVRKNMEETLQENEARYRALFTSAGDAIFLMDGKFFIECNPQALKLFGCSQEQIAGKTLDQLSPPRQPDGRDSREKAMEKITRVLEGNAEYFEWLHTRSSGETFHAEVSLNRLTLKGNMYLQAIVRDISQRKKAEQEQILRERLQGVMETAGAVCHELNQPMQIISGYADLMLYDLPENDPLYKKLRKLIDTIHRMQAISHRLMHITRYETKPYTGTRKIIDIDKSS